MKEFWNKIKRKWMKLRLQPIRVFCFHHVSAGFDAETMHKCDWMQLDEFYNQVLIMRKNGVAFISLTEAYKHITTDKWRKAKYAVLTFDDGWASLKGIIPWLVAQQIPVTLFINPASIEGIKKREIGECLKREELEELLKCGNGLISVASHGWSHTLCTDMSMSEFETSVSQSETYLKKYDGYISFFAYPCGRHSNITDANLLAKKIVPVYMDGEPNYANGKVIHRELIN